MNFLTNPTAIKVFFIIKKTTFGVIVAATFIMCVILTNMIILYKNEDGAFRRPHNLWANRTDNSILHRGIKYGIFFISVSSLLLHAF